LIGFSPIPSWEGIRENLLFRNRKELLMNTFSPLELEARRKIEAFRASEGERDFVTRQILLAGLAAIWVEQFSVDRLAAVGSILAGQTLDPESPAVGRVLARAHRFGLLRKVRGGKFEIAF
jgi:hypothetical protein